MKPCAPTYIFLPPLPRGSGGLFVLQQVGGHLFRAGFPVAFVQREAQPLPSDLPPVPVIAWPDMRLTAAHLWLVPEGWPNALAEGLKAGARCLVYVQNWAFALGVLPEGTPWQALPVDFIHVSDPVRWFMQEATAKQGPVLRPGIDLTLFAPEGAGPCCADSCCADQSRGHAVALAQADITEGAEEADIADGAEGAELDAADCALLGKPVRGPVRIAWMPRKNKALAQQIRAMAEERLRRTVPGLCLEWVEIHHRSPVEVAALLRSAHIFLATGFPEGCPLPPLEAMASGCVVVGFTGLGGWDYMRQVDEHSIYLARPWWPLRPVPWGGNGFYAADADIAGACMALEAACLLLQKGGPPLAVLRRNAARTAAAYAFSEQAQSVIQLWTQLTLTSSRL